MKRTGLNTWGSDILLRKPTYAIDSLKCLLLLAFNVLWAPFFFSKTGNLSASLHACSKNDLRACFAGGQSEKATRVFHIVEQENRKSTGAVNKKMPNTLLQIFTDILSVPYCGMVNAFS